MLNTQRFKKLSGFLTALMLFNLAGCATGKDPKDPYEPMNRQIFKFNTVVDKVVYRPIAKTYNAITPSFVQARVTNFFDNIDEIPTVANDILQLNVYQTFADTSRFVVNSTVGIGGLFDPATKIKLIEHHTDFGLTMVRWGYKNSAYFVIPFIGPSTFRDALGMPPNTFMNIWPYINPFWISYAAFGLNKVNQRTALLPTDKLVDQAFDPYIFVRDAYLQYRQGQINQIGKMDPGLPSNGDTFVAASDNNNDAATAPAPGSTPESKAALSAKPAGINGSKAALEAQAPNNNSNNNTNSTPATTIKPQSQNEIHHKRSHKLASAKKTHHKETAAIVLPFPKKLM